MSPARTAEHLASQPGSGQYFTPSQFSRNSIFDQPEAPTPMQARATRILVVDDNPCARLAIVQEFAKQAQIDVCGEAGSHAQGAALIRRSQYDILLVDLNLGDGSGFDLLQLSKALHPMSEVIIISVMEDLEHAFHAFELGATGYLVKSSWIGSFSEAVLQVAQGGAALSPNLARRIIKHLGSHNAAASQSREGHGTAPAPLPRSSPSPSAPPAALREYPVGSDLSSRELDILRQIANGLSSAEIGLALGISVLTVNTHVKNVYRKLQVNCKAKAIRYAIQAGLV